MMVNRTDKANESKKKKAAATTAEKKSNKEKQSEGIKKFSSYVC